MSSAKIAPALTALCAASFFLLPAPPAVAGDGGKTSVWKVSGGKGDATLYLAGSVHMLGDDDHPLPEAFESAYRASEGLVLEVTTAGNPAADAAAFEKGMYGPDGRIENDLSAAAYKKLRKFLEGAGLPPGAMDGFRPWMAAMTISLTEIMKLGYRPELGVDSYFEGKAIEDGKPVEGLETSEFQIGLFAKLDRELQEQMLVATLDEVADIETEFPSLVKAWREGDDETLRRLIFESMAEAPEFRAEVLDKRNLRWMGSLEKILGGERDVMVVVGAGHLVGEKGLVRLLRDRGYRVERWLPQPAKKPGGDRPRFIPVGV